jgi:hypothetical protein
MVRNAEEGLGFEFIEEVENGFGKFVNSLNFILLLRQISGDLK